MKRLLLVIAIVFLGLYSYSQVNSNAIGLRLGAGYISGVEISYQRGFSRSNRLEVDLGGGANKNYQSFALTGVYHWVWNITEGLNWFVGPGAGVAFVNRKHDSNYADLAIGGQIGLEYDFNTLAVPILVSLDLKPMWNLFNDENSFGWGLALGVRYTF